MYNRIKQWFKKPQVSCQDYLLNIYNTNIKGFGFKDVAIYVSPAFFVEYEASLKACIRFCDQLPEYIYNPDPMLYFKNAKVKINSNLVDRQIVMVLIDR